MPSREPKYGVELSFDDLNSQTPMSILYGVTENNKFIPIQIDTEGRFRLGSGVTLDVDSLELGDVGIIGNDPVSTNDHKISIDNLGVGNGWAIRSAIFDGGNKLTINPDGSINVNAVLASPYLSQVNEFTITGLVASGSPQIILTYTVPSGKTLDINQIVAWGTYDGEYIINVAGTPSGGGRTSGATRTLDVSYSSPIVASSGDIVNITVEHYSSTTEGFKANLIGGLK
jgi:hypothetical protein